MKFNVEVIEKETEEVIDFLFQVDVNVVNKIRNAYAFDPFYTVKISN